MTRALHRRVYIVPLPPIFPSMHKDCVPNIGGCAGCNLGLYMRFSQIQPFYVKKGHLGSFHPKLYMEFIILVLLGWLGSNLVVSRLVNIVLVIQHFNLFHINHGVVLSSTFINTVDSWLTVLMGGRVFTVNLNYG